MLLIMLNLQKEMLAMVTGYFFFVLMKTYVYMSVYLYMYVYIYTQSISLN